MNFLLGVLLQVSRYIDISLSLGNEAPRSASEFLFAFFVYLLHIEPIYDVSWYNDIVDLPVIQSGRFNRQVLHIASPLSAYHFGSLWSAAAMFQLSWCIEIVLNRSWMCKVKFRCTSPQCSQSSGTLDHPRAFEWISTFNQAPQAKEEFFRTFDRTSKSKTSNRRVEWKWLTVLVQSGVWIYVLQISLWVRYAFADTWQASSASKATTLTGFTVFPKLPPVIQRSRSVLAERAQWIRYP